MTLLYLAQWMINVFEILFTIFLLLYMILSETIIKSKSCKCMPLRCNFTRVDLQLIVQTKQCLRLALEVIWQPGAIFFFTFGYRKPARQVDFQ